MIAEAAYFRAERRDFNGGCEVQDWLAAEKDIDALLAGPDQALRQVVRTAELSRMSNEGE